MNNKQIEFTLSSVRRNRSTRRPNYRQTRARWWFDRMRQIAERAPDWPASAADRTLQINRH